MISYKIKKYVCSLRFVRKCRSHLYRYYRTSQISSFSKVYGAGTNLNRRLKRSTDLPKSTLILLSYHIQPFNPKNHEFSNRQTNCLTLVPMILWNKHKQLPLLFERSLDLIFKVGLPT